MITASRMGVDSSTVRGYWKKAIEELTVNVGDVIKILDGRVDGWEPDEGEMA